MNRYTVKADGNFATKVRSYFDVNIDDNIKDNIDV
jgi:hypothetical protein